MKNLFYTLCFAMLLVSCGKDGSMGPQGEQGEPGTANVVSSEWFPAKAWNSTLSSEITARYTISQAMLSEVNASSFKSFLDNGGTFMVYVRRENAYYHSLPFTYGVATTCDWALVSDDEANQFRFTIVNRNGGAIPDALSDHTKLELRYVLIPAGRVMNGVASVNGRQVVVDELKTMSYRQAGAVLGWEE